MNRIIAPLAIAAAAASPAGAQTEPPVSPPPREHSIVPLEADGKLKARGVPWEVVSGDPTKAGEPFVIRIFNRDNQVAPPHWHPGDEHIVVVRGKWHIGHGDKFDRSALRPLSVGDYVMMPKGMRHFAWSEGDTVVQVHGVGPFKINLARPWTMLGSPAAAGQFRFKDGQRVRSKRGEGVVRFGARSDYDQVIQYGIEGADGSEYYAFEDELQPAP